MQILFSRFFAKIGDDVPVKHSQTTPHSALLLEHLSDKGSASQGKYMALHVFGNLSIQTVSVQFIWINFIEAHVVLHRKLPSHLPHGFLAARILLCEFFQLKLHGDLHPGLILHSPGLGTGLGRNTVGPRTHRLDSCVSEINISSSTCSEPKAYFTPRLTLVQSVVQIYGKSSAFTLSESAVY